MSKDFKNDAFFDHFAVPVEIRGKTIKGIFENAQSIVNIETGQIETTLPQVIIKEIDIEGEAITHDEIIKVNDKLYRVKGITSDGWGLLYLSLTEAEDV